MNNPSDYELDEMLATKAAGYERGAHGEFFKDGKYFGMYGNLPKYSYSIVDVLPLLEKWRDRPYLYRMAQIDMTGTGWLVKLHDANKPDLIVKAEDPSLARAIVLALLPHYGVEVDYNTPKH